MGKAGKAIAKPFEAVGHAVKHVVQGVGKHVVAPVLGGLTGGGHTSSTVATPASTTIIQAQPGAAAAPADTTLNDTNVDTDATKRKKKAMGKKSLMIGTGSDSSSGGTTGTGLNL